MRNYLAGVGLILYDLLARLLIMESGHTLIEKHVVVVAVGVVFFFNFYNSMHFVSIVVN